MVIVAVQCSHLRQMASSVTVTGQAVQLSGSRNLFRGRGWFGRFGGLELLFGRPLLTLLLQHSLFVSHVPLVFQLFRLLLSTAPIIVWTVNEGSTPTTEPITLVKEDVALRVDALIVRIMCVAPAPPSIAVCVTASFTVFLTLLLQHSLFVSHVPLVFQLFRLLRISIGHVDRN